MNINVILNSYEDLEVSAEEVTHAIKKLEVNKARGSDGVYSEHIKYASNILVPLLSMCFTSCIAHGFLSESMVSVVLVPVINDKAGKLSSKDNYHPIALASVFILHGIEMYMDTNPNQFGFKKKHGTNQCIYVLKEVIDLYRSLIGSVFLCFLDASEAFDRVNHRTPFKKLSERVPGYTLHVLTYRYKNQTMCNRWGDVDSVKFKVTNGVRQGGDTIPLLIQCLCRQIE